MGDDPGAKSSSIAHQSEHAMIHCGIPVLNPSSIQDYLDLGILGWALSRYSGCWIGFKCLTDTIESSGSVSVAPGRVQIVMPTDFEPPASGLHIGWSNLPLQVEERLYEHRLAAVGPAIEAVEASMQQQFAASQRQAALAHQLAAGVTPARRLARLLPGDVAGHAFEPARQPGVLEEILRDLGREHLPAGRLQVCRQRRIGLTRKLRMRSMKALQDAVDELAVIALFQCLAHFLRLGET